MNQVALLFPGQGSQYAGMGRELCRRYGIAAATFEEASRVLGFDLQQLCFQADETELTLTENAQPALLTQSVAAFRVWRSECRIIPLVTAGHSLGEITALTCAGAIEFAAALRIVRQRGRFMQEAVAAGTGSMAAIIGAGRASVAEACDNESAAGQSVVISNYNAPDELVISGMKAAVERVGKRLAEKGAAVIPLKVSAPFHSPLMAEAAQKFRSYLDQFKFGPTDWPVISNTDARPYRDPAEIGRRLADQLVMPVLWTDIIAGWQRENIDTAIELGGKGVLKKLVAKNTPDIAAYAFSDGEDLNGLPELSGGLAPDTVVAGGAAGNYDAMGVINQCLKIAVCTRNRNWDNAEYQRGVVEPYNRIKALGEQLEQAKREPDLEQMKAALMMLRSVLTTKQVPAVEQAERFDELLTATHTRELFAGFKLIS